MKQLLTLAVLLIGHGLFAQHPIYKKTLDAFYPLNDAILIGKTEVSVGEYLEYLKSIKADSSNSFYKSQLPDSTSLTYLKKANEYYSAEYFAGYYNHPSRYAFPAVGISYEQAINFCKWKTWQFHQQNKKRKYKHLVFRLPSPAEWDKAVGDHFFYKPQSKKQLFRIKALPEFPKTDSRFMSEVSTFNVKDIELIAKNGKWYKTSKRQQKHPQDGPAPQPVVIVCQLVNQFGLHHLRGNVSEMTNIKGIAKGLNYSLDYHPLEIAKTLNYTQAAPWLGFRIIADLHPYN